MPRRSDASVRVGLCSIVRARISSKLANVAGPRTKSVIALALSRSTPGVMSTSTRRADELGRRSARAMAVSPPSDMPTTARGVRGEHGDRLADVGGERLGAMVAARCSGGVGVAVPGQVDGDERTVEGESRRCPRCGRSAPRRG